MKECAFGIRLIDITTTEAKNMKKRTALLTALLLCLLCSGALAQYIYDTLL